MNLEPENPAASRTGSGVARVFAMLTLFSRR
jgi:hypothetical protein